MPFRAERERRKGREQADARRQTKKPPPVEFPAQHIAAEVHAFGWTISLVMEAPAVDWVPILARAAGYGQMPKANVDYY